jgi:hypothetical protein
VATEGQPGVRPGNADIRFPSYWRIHGYPNNLKVPDPQWLAGTDPVAVHVDGNPEFDPTDS